MMRSEGEILWKVNTKMRELTYLIKNFNKILTGLIDKIKLSNYHIKYEVILIILLKNHCNIGLCMNKN